MPPTVAARSGAIGTSNVTSHPIMLPAGAVDGELQLVVVGVDGSPTVSTSSSGWVKLGQGGTDSVVAVFAGIAGTAAATLTLTTTAKEQNAHNTFRISDWSGDLNDIAVVFAAGASGSADPPSLVPAGGEQDYLWIVGATTASGATWPTAAPAGFANFVNRRGGTTSAKGNVGTAELAFAGASLDPGAFTNSSNQWAAVTIAIPPAPAGVEPGRMLLAVT